MKKLSVFIGILVLLFVSCKTIASFDESIPEEKTTRICMAGIGTVTEYNGISVKWEGLSGFKFTVNQIPAGDTLLQIDVDAQLSVFYNSYYNSNGNFVNSTTREVLKLNSALFKFNFQPQKEYYFDAAKSNDGYGLRVYAWDYTEKNAGSGTPKDFEKHFVTFVPFLKDNQGNNKKVLN